mmetsp:Transcript_5093/g.14617  ORF Transcript_5093/g.14617 Transcript_5093/m.14617 type:complete len:445 (+) Transcript_5093:1063-2397(+)
MDAQLPHLRHRGLDAALVVSGHHHFCPLPRHMLQHLRHTLVVVMVGVLDGVMDGGRVVQLKGALPLDDHVGAPHHLGSEVPPLLPSPLQVHHQPFMGVFQVALVSIVDDGLLAIVAPLQLHSGVVDGGLEVAVLRVHHHAHVRLGGDFSQLLEATQHVVQQLQLTLGEGGLGEGPRGAAVFDQQRDVLQLQPLAPRQVVHHSASPHRVLFVVSLQGIEDLLQSLRSAIVEKLRVHHFELVPSDHAVEILIKAAEQVVHRHQAVAHPLQQLRLPQRRHLDGGKALALCTGSGLDGFHKSLQVRVTLRLTLVVKRPGNDGLVLEFTRVGSALRLHIVLRGIIQDATDAVLVQVVQRGLDVLLILPATEMQEEGTLHHPIHQCLAKHHFEPLEHRVCILHQWLDGAYRENRQRACYGKAAVRRKCRLSVVELQFRRWLPRVLPFEVS